VGAAIVVGSTVFFAVDAAYTDVPNPPVTNSVGAVARPTLAALRAGELPGTGPDGRYYVTWNDQYSLGGRGYSLLVELERAGFTVGTSATSRVGVRSHRVMAAADATAQVHLVSGGLIADWAAKPGFERVAYYDPRRADERQEYERLRTEVGDDLRAAGLDSIATGIENGNLGVAFSPEVPERLRPAVARLIGIPIPLAVFVGPPGD
jgi:hypothetical protein